MTKPREFWIQPRYLNESKVDEWECVSSNKEFICPDKSIHVQEVPSPDYKEIAEKLMVALEFYAAKETYKDLWEYEGKTSPDFKYFYLFRSRTNDFEILKDPFHYYAGKRARQALEEVRKLGS